MFTWTKPKQFLSKLLKYASKILQRCRKNKPNIRIKKKTKNLNSINLLEQKEQNLNDYVVWLLDILHRYSDTHSII